MKRQISPSKILADASAIPAEGDPAVAPGTCAMCGVGYQVGDPVSLFSPASSFTNWSALANPEGTHVCGHCQALSRSQYMKAFQCLVASEAGVFRALSNNEVASVVLDPPAPPFIVHLGMIGKSSHVTWRTPVSLSRDVFLVRDGEQVIRINRPRVLDARKADLELLSLLAAHEPAAEPREQAPGKKKPKKKKVGASLKSCVWLSPSFGNGNNGQIHFDVLDFADKALAAGNSVPSELVGQLRALTPGDVWALHRLAYAESPARGEPIQPPILD